MEQATRKTEKTALEMRFMLAQRLTRWKEAIEKQQSKLDNLKTDIDNYKKDPSQGKNKKYYLGFSEGMFR